MPKLIDHARRKAELLDASLALVAAEGIEAATMRRLASAAACTTGTVTYYFEGRDALLVAMLRRAHERAAARMLEAASRAESPSMRLWVVIREALPFDEVRLGEWRVWLAFWGAASGNEGLIDEHRARYHEWRSLLDALTRDALRSNSGAALFASTLMTIVDGYGVQLALCKSARSSRAKALRQDAEVVLLAQFKLFGVALT